MDYTSATNYATVNGQRGYRDRDAANGLEGTSLIAFDRNALMFEVMKVITMAGLTPDASDWTQLYQALVKIVAQYAAAASAGFTPVEQGGGPNQGTNKINLGWQAATLLFRISVDGVDQGTLMRSFPQQAGDVSPGNFLFSTTENRFRAIAGSVTGELVDLSDYSHASSGDSTGGMMSYRKAPDGFIRQTGRVITPGVGTPRSYSVQFPIPFTTAITGYGATVLDAALDTNVGGSVGNYDLKHLEMRSAGGFSMTWWAEGY